MVLKVGGGHNCWLAEQRGLRRHPHDLDLGTGRAPSRTGGSGIVLEAASAQDPGREQELPGGCGALQSTVYPIVEQYCQRCHSTSRRPRSRRTSPRRHNEAYDAAKTKINLDQPAMSRLVVRLRNEFHNCWSDARRTRTR
jgi:hypothetical protein